MYLNRTWKSAKGEVGQAVKLAVQYGYRHLDCAALYMNEAEIGEALQEVFKEGKVKREDMFMKPHPHVIKLMGCVTVSGKGNTD